LKKFLWGTATPTRRIYPIHDQPENGHSALRLLEAIIDACKCDHGTNTLTAILTDAWPIVVVVIGVPDFYIHALVNLRDTERSNPPGDDIDASPQAERKTG
jgi:hypothetical protein